MRGEATAVGARVQVGGWWRWGAAAPAFALLLAACDRSPSIGTAEAAGPQSPSHARLVLLPDSAISVEPGSTEEQLAQFLASPAPAPRMFRFPGTEFEPWQSRPNAATLRTMYAIAQILRAYPKTTVTLIGHTDNDGTAEQNMALSRERVERMAALLVHAGIQPRRITTIGRGLTQPIADNGTAAGRARNRRIELVVTRK
jgi:outer membrane protein OmpA-like peptidoglycan-associated protein